MTSSILWRPDTSRKKSGVLLLTNHPAPAFAGVHTVRMFRCQCHGERDKIVRGKSVVHCPCAQCSGTFALLCPKFFHVPATCRVALAAGKVCSHEHLFCSSSKVEVCWPANLWPVPSRRVFHMTALHFLTLRVISCRYFYKEQVSLKVSWAVFLWTNAWQHGETVAMLQTCWQRRMNIYSHPVLANILNANPGPVWKKGQI